MNRKKNSEKSIQKQMIIGVCFFLAATFIPVLASSYASGRMTTDQLMSIISTRLNLSDEQTIQVRPTIENFFNKKETLVADFKNNRIDRKSVKSEIKKLIRTTLTDARPFLTDEQSEKLKAIFIEKLARRSQK